MRRRRHLPKSQADPSNPLSSRNRKRILPYSTEVSAELESKCFAIERASLADHLGMLRRIIGDGAFEMEMVAAERLFHQTLSKSLLTAAQSLRSLADELTRLRKTVNRATGYPKYRRKRMNGE